MTRQSGFSAAVLLAAVMLTPARASVAYAYSSNSITSFVISGVTVTSVSTNGTNVAAYSGLGVSRPPSGSSDAKQAFVGPAVPASQNMFDQLGSSGKDYARADSMTATDFPFSGANVAEVLRSIPGGATAAAVDSITFTLTVTSDEPVTFSFIAFPIVNVTTDGKFAYAEADLFAGLALEEGDDLLLGWRPDGTDAGGFEVNAGSVSGIKDPFSLNPAPLICDFDGCNKLYIKPTKTFEFTYTPESSGTLTGLFFLGEAATASIPEPASIGIFGMALTGVFWRKQSRRATRNRPVRGQ